MTPKPASLPSPPYGDSMGRTSFGWVAAVLPLLALCMAAACGGRAPKPNTAEDVAANPGAVPASAFVQADAFMTFRVDLGRLLQAPLLQPLLEQPMQEAEAQDPELVATMNKVEAVHVLLSEQDPKLVVVIDTHMTREDAEILSAHAAQEQQKSIERTERTGYEVWRVDSDSVALWFPASGRWVVTDELEPLEPVLQRTSRQWVQAGKDAGALGSWGDGIVSVRARQSEVALREMGSARSTAEHVARATLDLDLFENLDLRIHSEWLDADQLSKHEQMARGLLARAKGELAVQAMGLGPVLDAIQLRRDGLNFDVLLQLDSEASSKLVQQLSALVGAAVSNTLKGFSDIHVETETKAPLESNPAQGK